MKKGESTYKNKEWLEGQYAGLGRLDSEIADECDVSHQTVLYWRNKYNIPTAKKIFPTNDELKDLVESEFLNDVEIGKIFNLCQETIRNLRHKFNIKPASRLNQALTKERISYLYNEEKLPDDEIADILNVSGTYICVLRKRYGIQSRSLSEAFHLSRGNSVNLSQEAIEFIYGELLGDGCVTQHSKVSAVYGHSSKYRSYLEWLSSEFNRFGIEQVGKINRRVHKCGAITYKYTTRSYPELLEMRKLWYPYGKKIIPRSLRISPLMLRQHYIGDGALRHNGNGRPSISLHTDGFKPADVGFLRGLLKNVGIITSYYKSHNSIYISVNETPKFLSYIGNCPTEIESAYGYKWAVK